MLIVKLKYWSFFICLLGFTINLQAQDSTQEEEQEHSLIANYPNQTETYNYGQSSSMSLYGSGILPSKTKDTNTSTNETYEYGSTNHETTSNTYVTEETNPDNSLLGSFVDEILDIPAVTPPSNTPQTRVVPVATVEDIHGIDRGNRFEEYDRNGTLNTPRTNNDIPQTRVVPVATVEDIHGIDRGNRFEGYDRNGTLNTPNDYGNIPQTRVVPVATVEDIHGIDRRNGFEEYDRNGTLNTPRNNNDTPQTRVVPVATVEDIHGANRAYQPYENPAPVVQPSSVKTESMKQRRERYSTSTTYENRTYSPAPESRNNEYTIEANPKPKKRSFKEFIKEAFNPNDNSDMPDYNNNNDNQNEEKSYRPSRSSSSSSSSSEYKSSRPVRTKTYNNTQKESKQNNSSGKNQ